MPQPAILLPPSEGKASGGARRGRRRLSFPALDDARRTVAEALREAMADPRAAGGLLGVKGAALDAAIAANRDLDGPLLPAIERYTGVLYDNLDAPSLDAEARAHLDRQVIIVSGLWGLVRPADRIPDYKLKVDATLQPLGRLARWWRPHLSGVLDARVRGGLVWDLLPNAHASTWADPDRAPALRVTASFAAEHRRGGSVVRSTVTHWSKALKGALVRHLLSGPVEEADLDAVRQVLAAFRHPDGYALESLESDGSHAHATFVAPAG